MPFTYTRGHTVVVLATGRVASFQNFILRSTHLEVGLSQYEVRYGIRYMNISALPYFAASIKIILLDLNLIAGGAACGFCN